jgi:hypothetical protein
MGMAKEAWSSHRDILTPKRMEAVSKSHEIDVLLLELIIYTIADET